MKDTKAITAVNLQPQAQFDDIEAQFDEFETQLQTQPETSQTMLFVSYIFSTIKNELRDIYVERMLLMFVKEAQKELFGKNIGKKDDVIMVKNLAEEQGEKTLLIPLRLLNKNGGFSNYGIIKEALTNLANKQLQYEDKGTWKLAQIVNNVNLEKKRGSVEVTLNREIWKAILDFTKGYRFINMSVISKLSNWYSFRLYMLICGTRTAITFTIFQLRDIFCLHDRYPSSSNFIRNTIIPAQKEIDKYSPVRFEYRLNYKNKKEISSITFIPVDKDGNPFPSLIDNMIKKNKEEINEKFQKEEDIDIKKNLEKSLKKPLRKAIEPEQNDSATSLELDWPELKSEHTDASRYDKLEF